MPHPKSTVIPVAGAAPSPGDKAQRDAEILRLWEARWSGKKIAEHLGIKASTVGNVVHKNNAARQPRGRTITVDLQDAPVEAWQQAMLPWLEQAADALGATGAAKRATIFASLLRLRQYTDIEDFKTWAQQVTGYDASEIAAFVDRGIKGFLIIDNQPSAEAFRPAEVEEEGGDFAFLLIAGVFEGTFCRTTGGEYYLPDEAA